MTEQASPMHSPAASDAAEALIGPCDPEVERIRRIGRRLFDTASCIVRVGDEAPAVAPDGGAMTATETAFCYSMPLQEEPVAILDMRDDPALAAHALVAGPPYLRFYASHPVRSEAGATVGSIALLDYAPRPFREGDRHALADLAGLVEREMQLRSMNAARVALEKKNKNLRRKSLIDPQIGTWNRGAIMRILGIEAVRCEKVGVPLSLIVVDLDYFKKINDTYGHPAGDAVLVKVARRLRSCIRPQEALGRYGGEEFLVVLPGSRGATAMAVAERMRQAVVAEPETIGGVSLSLTISAGIASTDMFPQATPDELISLADTALYEAKNAGRNRVMQARPKLS